MNKAMIAVAAFTVMTSSVNSMAGNTYTSQQCKVWFKKVDRNKDGSIGASENADGYLARITLASETESSSGTYIMSKTFFLAECAIGSLGKPQT